MFKKGDRVYHITIGEGVISEIHFELDRQITVKFPNGDVGDYYLDGKAHLHHKHPSIYHTEPVITVPKRRVEHTGWIGVECACDSNGIRGVTQIHPSLKSLQDVYSKLPYEYTPQQITFITEEN